MQLIGRPARPSGGGERWRSPRSSRRTRLSRADPARQAGHGSRRWGPSSPCSLSRAASRWRSTSERHRPWTSQARAPASSAATRVTPTDVPDGWRLFSNKGLEIGIPKSWPLISLGCDIPKKSTLIVTGGAGPSCGWIEPPKLTIVRIEDIDSAKFVAFDDTVESNVRTRSINVSGQPATERTSTLSDGRTRLAVTVPSRRATLIAAGPDPALLARIVGTARVFDVDLNGCSWQAPQPPSWDRPSSQQAIDVGQPDSVTVCSYAGTLVTSATLHGASQPRSSARSAAPAPGSHSTYRQRTASTEGSGPRAAHRPARRGRRHSTRRLLLEVHRPVRRVADGRLPDD